MQRRIGNSKGRQYTHGGRPIAMPEEDMREFTDLGPAQEGDMLWPDDWHAGHTGCKVVGREFDGALVFACDWRLGTPRDPRVFTP